MPKIIELTVEIEIQRVSCPGVWLCQDGRVSLSVFALGTSYQTCLLPPMFPLVFKDIFYFRKRFHETCAVNNMSCLLKNETIYCELVQWCNDCVSGECNILAQYLGALNDVLFPPNMCSNDGVDLLMRRSRIFPGILAPKIEIATKVRIDEVWNQPLASGSVKASSCDCPDSAEVARQKQVCHSPQYHRHKCGSGSKKPPPAPKSALSSSSRSRLRSGESRSCCSLTPKKQQVTCECPNSSRSKPSRSPSRHSRKCPDYNVYNVQMKDTNWIRKEFPSEPLSDNDARSIYETDRTVNNDDRIQKLILESRFIEQEEKTQVRYHRPKTKPKEPCVCEICRRYHELFHKGY